MKQAYLLIVTLAVTPTLAHAQGLEEFFENLTLFVGNVLIPFLFGIAFLFFIINAVRFFVLESSNEDGREKARKLITYSIVAFVFLVIFWGIINLLSTSLGLDGCEAPMNDYQKENFVGPMLPGC